MKKLLLLLFFLPFIAIQSVFGQSISLTNTYSQNFNTLSSSAGTSTVMPNGWFLAETGANANLTYTVGTGNSTSGDTYSFGGSGSTNRALGGLASNALTPGFGASFTNATSQTITSITVSYTGQTWRIANGNRTDKINFLLSTTASTITANDFNSIPELDYENVALTNYTSPISGSVLQSKLITYTINNITVAPNGTFWIKFVDVNVSGNDDGLAIDDFSLSYTTASSTSIAITPSALSFSNQNINTTSAAKSVTINYNNLTAADLNLASSGPFTIAKTENGTYNTTLVYTNSELSSNATDFFVKFTPTVSGNSTGTVSIFGGGTSSTTTVNLSGNGIDPNFEINSNYSQNFDDANYLSNSYWTQINVKGSAKTWEYSTTQAHAGAGSAYMNGFAETEVDANGNQPSDDWLISPKINLTSFSNFPVINFWSRKFFVGPDIKFYVSTTYNRSGVINLNEWTELNNVGIPSATGVWTKSNGIDLSAYKTANVHVAFRYITDNSGNSNSAEWRVDDFSLTNTSATASIPNNVISFPETLMGSTSATNTFNFSASGYGDLTLTSPQQFEISGDNITYSNIVTVAASDAASGKTIYARFKPTSTTAAVTGTINVNATGLTVQGPSFFASSLAKSTTFDLASWNMEFFGNGTTIPNYGPANRSLQISNATIVYNKMLPDVIGIQEISDETAVDQLLANLPSTYKKKISQVYSYSIKPPPSPDPFPTQKVGFIYNSATVDTVGFKVVFLDEYRSSVVNGTTNAYNIDGNSWSSGRLPYIGRFNVTTQDGLKKTVNIAVIHAKSGSATADYNRREQDIIGLKNFLLSNYPGSVAVLGDYNDLVEGSIASGKPSPFKVLSDNGYRALTLPLLQAGQGTFVGGNNPSMIDNILVTNDLSSFYEENSTRIEDARTYITNYANNTSDHLPVYARFTFSVGTLPIKLSSFTAQASGNKTNLKWTTESETDNDYFLIERAGEDKKFTTVGRIKGSGTTSMTKSYIATDQNPLSGNNYYRLKQVDLDGKFSYSEERVVKFTSLVASNLTVYPNPANDKVTLNLNEVSGTVVLKVTAVDGKTVFSDAGTLEEVNQRLNQKLSGFAPGVYVLALTANGKQQQTKLVKQ